MGCVHVTSNGYKIVVPLTQEQAADIKHIAPGLLREEHGRSFLELSPSMLNAIQHRIAWGKTKTNAKPKIDWDEPDCKYG